VGGRLEEEGEKEGTREGGKEGGRRREGEGFKGGLVRMSCRSSSYSRLVRMSFSLVGAGTPNGIQKKARELWVGGSLCKLWLDVVHVRDLF
jgi:hypothetical protein